VRVLVAGGTGFIGRPLCRALAAEGHAVTVITRNPGRVGPRAVGWEDVAGAVGASDAVINLAGDPIAAGRWTAARKARIRDSRITTTRTLVEAARAASRRPTVLVNASAVGYYGPHGEEPLDETTPAGTDFLAGVCEVWEREAIAAEALGVRVVRLRLGVVLACDGGARHSGVAGDVDAFAGKVEQQRRAHANFPSGNPDTITRADRGAHARCARP